MAQRAIRWGVAQRANGGRDGRNALRGAGGGWRNAPTERGDAECII